MNVNVRNITDLLNDGEDLSGTIAQRVSNQFLSPIAEAYKTLGSDWEGSAAANHLPKVKAFYDDLEVLYNYLISTGNSISKIAEYFDRLEQQAGGTSRGITAAVKSSYSGILASITKDPGQSIKITQASAQAGNQLTAVANNLDSLISDIRSKKDQIFNNWMSGGNPETINSKIEEALTKMSSFKTTVIDVTTDIENGIKVFQGLDSSGVSPSGGSTTYTIN